MTQETCDVIILSFLGLIRIVREPRERFYYNTTLLFPSAADILVQALDVLRGVVGQDEGRGFFLRYEALAAMLALLKTGSPRLLAPTLDVLLQMSADSREFLSESHTPSQDSEPETSVVKKELVTHPERYVVWSASETITPPRHVSKPLRFSFFPV